MLAYCLESRNLRTAVYRCSGGALNKQGALCALHSLSVNDTPQLFHPQPAELWAVALRNFHWSEKHVRAVWFGTAYGAWCSPSWASIIYTEDQQMCEAVWLEWVAGSALRMNAEMQVMELGLTFHLLNPVLYMRFLLLSEDMVLLSHSNLIAGLWKLCVLTTEYRTQG